MSFARRGAVALVAAVMGTALLGACSSDKGENPLNSRAEKPDAASMDCTDPNMPVGEWKKRCEGGASPDADGKPTGKSTEKPGNSPPKSDPEPEKGAAKPGDTIAMQGDDREKFDATLVQIVDPGTPKDEYSKPDEGNRIVAIQWRVTNTGTTVVDQGPAFDTKLVDAQGQVYEISIGADHKGAPFPTSVQIPPGESRLGFVTYEVPKDVKIVKVEFEGGYDKPTGQWAVA